MQGFVFIHGQQFWLTDELPKPGDLFMDLDNNSYAKCNAVVNNDSIVRDCMCGMCDGEELIIPIHNCRKLKPVDIHNN